MATASFTRADRRSLRPCLLAASLCLALAASTAVVAQPPGFVFTPPYPQAETDPDAVARGRQVYEAYGCSFCHGGDIRGGAGGPSLLRSPLVQNDVAGELISDVIRNGVPNTTMAGFGLTPDEVADVAEFFNSFRLDSRDRGQMLPETIVSGNPRAGRRYFDRHCGSCHSVTGDLAGIASRIPDPRALQQHWLMPRDASPVIATVAGPEGTVAGRLVRLDEFLITIETDDGWQRTFAREGDAPAVTLDDPLAAHQALLPDYTDGEIHDVTAYLVTIER